MKLFSVDTKQGITVFGVYTQTPDKLIFIQH